MKEMGRKKKAKVIVVGRKKIQYWHDNFEYYQPNDHLCGDCAVRALTKVLGKTWRECLAILFETALELQEPVESCENITAALKRYGFVWKSIKVEKGDRRPTVSVFADYIKTDAICRVSGHVVAVHDGKYFDVWDSGDKSLYGYWVKEN